MTPSNRPRIRIMMAVSLDGRIADGAGGVGWLDPYAAEDTGFDAFLAGIGALVMGRRTYDQVRGFGDWPYRTRPCQVVTRRPLAAGRPDGVIAAPDPISAIDRAAAGAAQGDVWIVSGAEIAQAALAEDRVDSIELAIVPTVLGAGPRLFAEATELNLDLIATKKLGTSLVAANYAPRH